MSDQPDGDSVWEGIALTFGFHVLAVAVLAILHLFGLLSGLFHRLPMLSWVPLWFFLLLGVTQLIYMIPAVFIASRQGRPNDANGLIIGAAVTFMLNAACWAPLIPQGFISALRSIFPFGR